MSSQTLSKHLGVIAALVIAIVSGPAQAELVFTSEPPTRAVVGQTYSYKMTAVSISNDDDDDDDDNYADSRDRRVRFIARALPPWLRFDGNDTLFGVPDAGDVAVHGVRLRARMRGDHIDQEFSITVDPLPSNPPPEGADLAASISVAPNPVSVGVAAAWRVTVRNLADADVANIVLETAISSDAPFSIDYVDDPSCSLEARGDHTAVVCRWSPLMSGQSRSAELSGTASGAGEILAIARVSIVDASPTDRNRANDEARITLSVDDDRSGEAPGKDGSSPVLTLHGASAVTITVGETYQDAGATAIDDADGDLTSEILVDNPVDTSVIGRYSVTYDVADRAGNVATATRTVEVVPRDPTGGGGGGSAGLALLLLVSCGLLGRRVASCIHRGDREACARQA